MSYTPAFLEALNTLLVIEGGYANIDGGTKYGVVQELFSHYFPGRIVSTITQDEAAMIYWEEFWQPMRLEKLSGVSPKIAYKLFQWGVNAGIRVAVTNLQSCLNKVQVPYQLYVDGILGSKTIAAVVDYVGQRKESILYKMLNCQQGCYYMSINQGKNIEGWFEKRIS